MKKEKVDNGKEKKWEKKRKRVDEIIRLKRSKRKREEGL